MKSIIFGKTWLLIVLFCYLLILTDIFDRDEDDQAT